MAASSTTTAASIQLLHYNSMPKITTVDELVLIDNIYDNDNNKDYNKTTVTTRHLLLHDLYDNMYDCNSNNDDDDACNCNYNYEHNYEHNYNRNRRSAKMTYLNVLSGCFKKGPAFYR